MPDKAKNRALFLDRDGTINVEKNYLSNIEDFEFVKGILKVIKKYQDLGFLIFIVTNQSGIARGFYTKEDFLNLTNQILDKFDQQGVSISKVYYCPHHPDITGPCACRKPKPGMILQALEEFSIDPETSVLIGDKQSDILAGKNAGIGTNLAVKDVLS